MRCAYPHYDSSTIIFLVSAANLKIAQFRLIFHFMKDIHRLARLARQLEEQTAVCKRCGICQSVCPLFTHTRMEKDIARGKIAVLEGVMTEVVKNADTVLAQLDRCLLCGRCAAVCPNGVQTLEIFIKARLLLTEYRGLSWLKKIIFRIVLVHPGRFERAAAMAARVQNLFFKPGDTQPEIRRPRRGAALFLPDRQVPPLAAVPFHRIYETTRAEDRKEKRGTVLFYTGCLIDKIFPEVGRASMAALCHHGFQADLIENEACCGIPALAGGDEDTFNRLVAHNMRLITAEKFDWLVSACATCTFTIKKLWPQMTGPENEYYQEIQRLAEKTVDITELITGCLPETLPRQTADPVCVTYHDPCHLGSSLGVFQAPRKLIEHTAGCQLVEMEEADTCCGMGGGFGLTHQKLSAEIGRLKKDRILNTGCPVVATACPACIIQLAGLLAHAGRNDIAVRHPIELYMESPDIS